MTVLSLPTLFFCCFRVREVLLYIEEGAVCVLSYEWLNCGLALGLLVFLSLLTSQDLR